MALFSLRDISRGTGIAYPTVRQHKHRGFLVFNDDGMIDTSHPKNVKYIREKTKGKGLDFDRIKDPVTPEKEKKEPKKKPVTIREPKKPKEQLELELQIIQNQKLKDQAETDLKVRAAELKRVQLEEKAGKLLPVDLVQKVMVINFQSIYINLNNELSNIAGEYVERLGGTREDLANIEVDMRAGLDKIMKKTKEDTIHEIENAIDNYISDQKRDYNK